MLFRSVSRDSACDYQAHEQAGVAWLSLRLSRFDSCFLVCSFSLLFTLRLAVYLCSPQYCRVALYFKKDSVEAIALRGTVQGPGTHSEEDGWTLMRVKLHSMGASDRHMGRHTSKPLTFQEALRATGRSGAGEEGRGSKVEAAAVSGRGLGTTYGKAHCSKASTGSFNAQRYVCYVILPNSKARTKQSKNPMR